MTLEFPTHVKIQLAESNLAETPFKLARTIKHLFRRTIEAEFFPFVFKKNGCLP